MLLVALVPVLLVQAGIYYRWLESRQERGVRENLEVARSTALLLDGCIHDLAHQEMALGMGLASLQPYAAAQASKFLADGVSEYPYVRSACWVSPDGKIVGASDPAMIGEQIGSREIFQEALETKQPWVLSDLYEVDGEAHFAVLRCIRGGTGEPIAVLVATVDPARLELVLDVDRLNHGGVLVMDRHGRVVCRCPHMAMTWEQRLHEVQELPAVTPLRPEATGTEEAGAFSGQKLAVARVLVGDLGWVVGAARPESDLMAPVWEDLLSTGIAALVALGASIGLAVIISRRISDGIRRLRDHARALGRGRLEPQEYVSGIDELCEVVQALNESAALRKQAEEALRELNETLERRVAERTAVAHDRAAQLRVLASQMTQAEERERRRVAHILHEHFQQLLVGAKFEISLLQSQMCGRHECKGPPIAERINVVLDEAIAESSSLTVELSPPILYAAGLTEALRWLGRWMQEKHGLAVDVQVDAAAEPRMENLRVLLFHGVRELLNNVVKHAQTKKACVRMEACDGRQIEVTVSDAGVGLQEEQLWTRFDSTSGLGLFRLRERLELLGGQLVVESRPGQGTRVVVRVPGITA